MFLRCEFAVIGVTDDTVYIVDLDQARVSVTVDAANVVAWVQKKYPGKSVIYRDTEYCWARISILSNNAIGFWPIENGELPEFAHKYMYPTPTKA
jgi:hypothetical protein